MTDFERESVERDFVFDSVVCDEAQGEKIFKTRREDRNRRRERRKTNTTD